MVADSEVKALTGNNGDPDEEEELEDPQDTMKEACAAKPECQALKNVLEECTERVNSRSSTSETCTQELFDFMHCVDHCVSKDLFGRLK